MTYSLLCFRSLSVSEKLSESFTDERRSKASYMTDLIHSTNATIITHRPSNSCDSIAERQELTHLYSFTRTSVSVPRLDVQQGTKDVS